MSVEVTIETITPEIAREWLGTTKRNRPVSELAVGQYGKDLSSDSWQFTGDPIRFDTGGNLIDGQHRLHAITRQPEGFEVESVIIRGLEPESQLVMDQGRRRTPGQQLALLGVKHSNNVASVAKMDLLWSEGLLFRDTNLQKQITVADIEEWVAEHPEDVEHITDNIRSIRAVDAPPSITGVAFLHFHRIDPEGAVSFLEALSTGANLSEGDPILTLKNRFHRLRREGTKIPDRDLLAFLVLAWNAHRAGRSMTKFQRPRGGRWTEANFPVPR